MGLATFKKNKHESTPRTLGPEEGQSFACRLIVFIFFKLKERPARLGLSVGFLENILPFIIFFKTEGTPSQIGFVRRFRNLVLGRTCRKNGKCARQLLRRYLPVGINLNPPHEYCVPFEASYF